MQTSRGVEILVGIFVAAGMAAFFMLAMKVSNISALTSDDSYQLEARFDNIGGLKIRSPVRIGGVRIGRVTDISYDDDKLEAVVHMQISQRHRKLPSDSTANIYTAGLLGEQYISIEPGGSEEFLQDGMQIVETQSAFVLERMIGKYLIQSPTTQDGQ